MHLSMCLTVKMEDCHRLGRKGANAAQRLADIAPGELLSVSTIQLG